MVHFRLLPRDRRFFEHFEQAAAVIQRAAAVLVDLMEHYQDVPAKLSRLEDLEHEGDQITHAVMQALNQTFITPLDREDISQLAQRLDDVTDLIWTAADRLRIYRIEQVTPAAAGLARVLEQHARVLAEAVALLRDQRHLQQILPLTVEINRLENEADDLLRDGIAQLFSRPDDPRDIVLSIKWREIYEYLEQASDTVEDAANVLEGIVIKHARGATLLAPCSPRGVMTAQRVVHHPHQVLGAGGQVHLIPEAGAAGGQRQPGVIRAAADGGLETTADGLNEGVSVETADDEVDGQGQDRRIEDKGQHGVDQHDPPNRLVGDGHVGGLEGHADREGEIGEVEVIRWATGERQRARATVVDIVEMRIVESEGRVHQHPRGGHRHDAQADEQLVLARWREGLRLSEQGRGGGEADETGQECHGEHPHPPWILDRRPPARAFGVGAQDEQPGQAQQRQHGDVPPGEHPHDPAKVGGQADGNSDGDAGGQQPAPQQLQVWLPAAGGAAGPGAGAAGARLPAHPLLQRLHL